MADVHVGNHRGFGGASRAGVNDRARLVADTFRAALDRAVADGAGVFVVCGDLLDVDDPSPQLLTLTAEVLADTPIPVVILVGNHDQRSTTPGDHALGPLGALPRVFVVERATRLPFRVGDVDLDLLALPFEPDDARRYIPARIAELAPRCRPGALRVVAIHAGVADDRTSVFLRDSHEGIAAATLLSCARDHGVGLVVAGNWHDRRRWQIPAHGAPGGVAHVVQVGALVPTGFDNPGGAGRYGGLCLYGPTGELTLDELPGPRFVVVRNDDEYGRAAADPTARPLFVRWDDVAPESTQTVAATLARDHTAGVIGGWAVERSTAVEQASRVEAATAARAADTLAAAVHDYVHARQFASGVTPAEVLGEALGYLGVTQVSTSPASEAP